ncbi:MAG: hypothetical protein MRJ66_05905 [Nitrospira sp.]|nr:hypothetical protein [Nitrospira sp.]
MPDLLRKFWDDIRPNLIWWGLVTLLGSTIFTAFFAGVQSWLERPISVGTAATIFLSFSFLLLLLKALTHGKQTSRKAEHFMNTALIYFPVALGLAICLWGYIVGKKVFQMADDVELLNKRMERYVLPRQLTGDQKKTIADYLSKFDPQPIVMKVVPKNEEASSYRADLQQALEKGGWPVANITYDEGVQEGLRIEMTEPMQEPGQPDPFEKLNPKKKPNDVLHDALTQAGILVSGTGSGSGRNITSTTITISIGNRRRDKWAIPPSAFMRRSNVELPEDPDRGN